MTWELRRIPLLPLIKVSFVVYFVLSLVGMLFYMIFLGGMLSMVGGMVGQDLGMDLAPLTGGAMVIAGLVGAVFGSVIYTLVTLVAGVLYNAVAGMIGGLEFEFEPDRPLGGYQTREYAPAAGSYPSVEEEYNPTSHPVYQPGAQPPPRRREGPDVTLRGGPAQSQLPRDSELASVDPAARSQAPPYGSTTVPGDRSPNDPDDIRRYAPKPPPGEHGGEPHQSSGWSWNPPGGGRKKDQE